MTKLSTSSISTRLLSFREAKASMLYWTCLTVSDPLDVSVRLQIALKLHRHHSSYPQRARGTKSDQWTWCIPWHSPKIVSVWLFIHHICSSTNIRHSAHIYHKQHAYSWAGWWSSWRDVYEFSAQCWVLKQKANVNSIIRQLFLGAHGHCVCTRTEILY